MSDPLAWIEMILSSRERSDEAVHWRRNEKPLKRARMGLGHKVAFYEPSGAP